MKQAAREHELDGFATECWTGFPRELGLNPCLGFIEDSYSLACEGDVMLCIGLLIARFLTGESAYVGDLFDLDMDGTITLVHCGGPASLAGEKKEVVLAPSQLASERGFETATVHPRIAPGPVTLVRFYGQDCDRMHVAFGELTGSGSPSQLDGQGPVRRGPLEFSGSVLRQSLHCGQRRYPRRTEPVRQVARN